MKKPKEDLDSLTLIELGKAARASQMKFEQHWKELHKFIEEQALRLAGEYTDWQSLSLEFCALFEQLQPGVFSKDWSFEDQAERGKQAREMLEQIADAGVDLSSVLSWRLDELHSLAYPDKKALKLEALDGAYLAAMDFALEAALYGRELSARERRKWGVMHSVGKIRTHFTGRDPQRGKFPLGVW